MVILTNVSGSAVSIRDMGLYLEDTESVDIDDLFNSETILASEDIEPALISGDITCEIEGAFGQTWDDIVFYYKRLTEYEHLHLDELVHGLYETSYFEATKDVNNRTQFITYYTDATKTVKIREEEITRGVGNKAASIIIRQYDENGNLKRTETQTLNRGVTGKVENITSGVV